MKVNLENFKSYSINAIVILFSVILSFYIDGRRELNEKNINKNKLINDLINTINEEIIEDKEANLNNKDKVIQLIPKIKNNLMK